MERRGSCLPEGSVEAALVGIGVAFQHAQAMMDSNKDFGFHCEELDRLRSRYSRFKGDVPWYDTLLDMREEAFELRRGRQ